MPVSPDAPNILWIMVDQYHHDAMTGLGAHPVRTPNLDRIASRGVRFETCYCPSPVCGPCRVSLFTGLWPREHGVRKNWLCHDIHLPELPELLRRGGYQTAQVGKLHLEPAQAPHGFELRRHHDSGYSVYYDEEPWQSDYMHWLAETFYEGDMIGLIDRFDADEAVLKDNPEQFILGANWRTEEQHDNTWVTDRTAEFLAKDRDGCRPFFLYASYFGPHQPMAAPPPWDTRFDPDDIDLPPEYHVGREDKPIARDAKQNRLFATLDEAAMRRCLAAYYGQIEMIDHGVGRILDALDQQGLADNTVVVFTADHGDHAGQFGWLFKGTMYDGAVRVPMILADPAASASAGSVCPPAVNNMDLMATLLGRAGLDTPDNIHSNNLAPLLDNPSGKWDRPTFSSFKPPSGDYFLAARGNWKLFRWRREDGSCVDELYDTSSEVHDETNRVDDPDAQSIRDDLQRLMDQFANQEYV